MELAVDCSDVSIAYLIPDPIKSRFTYWKCTLSPASINLKGKSLYEVKKMMNITNNINL